MQTKFKLLFVFIFLCIFNTQAQDSINGKRVIYRELPVYRDVDVMATYRGGYEVVLKKIETATKNCKNGQIKTKDALLVLDVLVTDKGKVAQVDFVNSPVSLCNNDILSAIKSTTQWVPARINNTPVNSYVTLKINLFNTNH